MSEQIYEQVESAITSHLHLGGRGGNMTVHGMSWDYPVGIELGNIVLRDSDCGLVKPTWEITTDEWRERVEHYGLYKKVGFWSFVPADDPAASTIAFCERHPHSAGRELYKLRMEAKP